MSESPEPKVVKPYWDKPANVSDSKELEAEITEIHKLIKDQTAEWAHRVEALQRVDKLVSTASKFDNFVDLIVANKDDFSEQILDRRSSVVKVVCNTLTELAKVANDLKKHADLVAFFVFEMESLFQCLPITVKIIASSARDCLASLAKNLNDTQDHALAYKLLEGTQSKHKTVRSSCFENLVVILEKLPADFDSTEAERVKIASEAKVEDAKKTHLLDAIEKVVLEGMDDSDGEARSGARDCVIRFMRLSKQRFDKLVEKQPAATRKAIDVQVNEYVQYAKGSDVEPLKEFVKNSPHKLSPNAKAKSPRVKTVEKASP